MKSKNLSIDDFLIPTATPKPTKEQVQAAVQMIMAMGNVIKEFGSVPSGHLYARLMGKLSLGEYEKIIGTLKNAGLVREVNYLLIWTGPGSSSNN